jgi:hypothetical protein
MMAKIQYKSEKFSLGVTFNQFYEEIKTAGKIHSKLFQDMSHHFMADYGFNWKFSKEKIPDEIVIEYRKKFSKIPIFSVC